MTLSARLNALPFDDRKERTVVVARTWRRN
jgi:hypothetical protein